MAAASSRSRAGIGGLTGFCTMWYGDCTKRYIEECRMDYEVSIDIDAPAELVWAEMSDVERWPESTRSISSVRRLDRGPFGLGSRARVKQPRFTPLVWTVTHFEE